MLLTSHYAGSSMSSFVVFDMKKKNEAHSLERDPSKIVATLVAVFIFAISALLVVVTWKRKNKYVVTMNAYSTGSWTPQLCFCFCGGNFVSFCRRGLTMFQ